MTNGVTALFGEYWEPFVRECRHYLDQIMYIIYTNLTIYSVVLFVFKLPMIIYTQKFLRNMYTEKCERIKNKRRELEDILLKIEILNEKMACRDADIIERQRRRIECMEQLHIVRDRVRLIISKKKNHQRGLHKISFDKTTMEESKLIEELLKGVRYEQGNESLEEKTTFDNRYDSIGHQPNNAATNAGDNRDYYIKIVKVTNVYKMSYLQNYLKVKRQHAVLKKRVNKAKKTLDDWHRVLNMVTRNRCTNSDLTSDEAMGDYNKEYTGELLKSDDIEDRADNFCEDYNIETQNQCEALTIYGYDDTTTESNIMPVEYDCIRNYDSCQMSLEGLRSSLCVLPEETNSEIDIEINE